MQKGDTVRCWWQSPVPGSEPQYVLGKVIYFAQGGYSARVRVVPNVVAGRGKTLLADRMEAWYHVGELEFVHHAGESGAVGSRFEHDRRANRRQGGQWR